MTREVKRREFEPRQSLKEAGIISISAEVEEGMPRSIIIEHDKDDRQSIIIPVTREWYGDVRENFKTMAEQYFKPDVVLQLDREIGLLYVQVIEEELREKEKCASELKQKSQQARTKLQQLQQQQQQQKPTTEIETEIITNPYGDWEHPITVTRAMFSESGNILTVVGQITAMGRVQSMIKRGLYQCQRCSQLQWITYERPFAPSDEIPDPWTEDMCRFCEKENLTNKEEKRSARILRLRKLGPSRSVKIELMDTETYSDINTLQVVFFDDKAEEAHTKTGERVIVRGKLYDLRTGRRSGAFYPVLYAHDARYVNEDRYELTTREIEDVRRFVRITSKDGAKEDATIDWLTQMYAPHVIWNELAKEALLYAEVSAGADVESRRSHGNKRRRRIHVGLAGNAGLGKSMLARVSKAHDNRNRYESIQSSTGKSLTAIVSREGVSETPILRVGPLARAKEGVIAVNEFGRQSLEDQGHFLDAAEEGEFTLNKHGINARIRADTVIIWTANPTQAANWSDNAGDAKISLDDLNVLKEFVDRTDILVIFKPINPLTQRDKLDEYNRIKAEMEEHPERVPSYDLYIRKHLAVAKRYHPIITSEATYILKEAHTRIQEQMQKHGLANAGSFRVLDRLIRITESVAKLKLKDKADDKDARRAVSFYNSVYSQMHGVIAVPENPRDVAYLQVLYLYQEKKGQPIAYKDAVGEACKRNPDVDRYFKGGHRNIRDNWQMHAVKKMLENHSRIKRVPPLSPTTFQWKIEPEERVDAGDAVEGSRDSALQKEQEQSGEQSEREGSNSNYIYESITASTTSTTSTDSYKKPIHDNKVEKTSEEYKILKAMELAMLDYKHEKVTGEES